MPRLFAATAAAVALQAAAQPRRLAAAPLPVPGMTCSNAPLAEGTAPWASTPMPAGWRPVYATVLQRHWDRWLYEHSLIKDRCWPRQLNSTTPPMPAQCGYNLSNVWEVWPVQPDPYAAPAAGRCSCPQLTQQGKDHALSLGRTLRKQYAGMLQRPGRPSVGCRAGSVGLETAKQQKNEMSLQTAYLGLCGALPSPSDPRSPDFQPMERVIYAGVSRHDLAGI